MGGSGQISECMAQELGDLVKLNSPVYRIDQTGDMVVVETVDKQTYKVCISEEEGCKAASFLKYCPEVSEGTCTSV